MRILLPVFIEEGRDLLPQMGRALRLWQQNPADASAAAPILRFLHTLKGSARMAGAMGLGQHLHEIETRIEQITYADAATPAALEDLLARHDYGLQLFEVLQNPQLAPQAPLAANAEDSEQAQPVVLPQLMPVATTALGTIAMHRLPSASESRLRRCRGGNAAGAGARRHSGPTGEPGG